MAAGRIKGITIEINGDVSKLTGALSSVDRAISVSKKNLRDLQSALKLDPTNISLIKDKHEELGRQIEDTKSKIKTEQEALRQLSEKLKEPVDIDHVEEFQKNAEAARELKTQIDLDTAALKELQAQGGTALGAVGDTINAWGSKVEAAGKKISQVGDTLTTRLSLPLAAVGTAATKNFAEVDKTMTLVRSTMGKTKEEAEILEQAMMDAAANSKFGMNDAATAALNFARAGLDAEQAAAAMAPAMNLAAGEGGNLDTVSSGLVATINGFGDAFEQAGHYTDVFAAACNSSMLDVDSLSNAMSIAAPVFKTAGKSVDDAALYMGIMANAGIDANTAANSLKTGMARLAAPTKQAREAMEQYGIAASDIWNEDGSMKDAVRIQEALNGSFGKLSEQEQMAAASAIFGKNQMASWLALINTAPDDVQNLSNAISGCEGTTKSMADAMMSGFGGSLEKLKSSLDVLAYSIGQTLAPMIQTVVDKIQALVDRFNSLDEKQRETIVKIGLAVAAIGPVLSIVGRLTTGIGQFMQVLGPVITKLGAIPGLALPVGSSFGEIAAAIGAVAGPIAIAVAAIGALAAAFKHLWDTNEEFRTKMTEIWEGLKSKFGEFIDSLKEKLEVFRPAFETIMSALSTAWETFCNFLAPIFEGVWSAVSAVLQGAMDVMLGILDVFAGLFTGNWEQTWNGVKEIFGGIWDAMTGIVQAACDTIGGIAEQIRTTIGALIDSAVQWGKDLISNFIGGIADNIKWLTDTVSNVANGIREFLHFSVPDKGPLSDFDTYGPDMMKLLASGIEQGFVDVRSAISKGLESVKGILDTFTVGMTGWTEQIRTATLTFIQQLHQQIITALQAVRTSVLTEITLLSEQITISLAAIGAGISSFASEVQTVIQNALTSIKNNLDVFLSDSRTSVHNGLSMMYVDTQTMCSQFVQLITQTTETIKRLLDTMLSGIHTNLTTKINAVKTAVQNFINWANTAITNFTNQTKSKVDTMLNNIKSKLSTSLSSMRTSLTNFLSNTKSDLERFKTDVSAILKDIKKKVNTVMTNIKKNVNTVMTNIKKKVNTVMTNIKKGVQEKMEKVVQVVHKKMKKIEEIITEVAASAFDWGAEIGRNLADGMWSMVGEVEAAAAALAAAAHDYIGHSTPKKGPLKNDDEFGAEMVQNFVDGVQSMEKTLGDVMAETFDVVDITATAGKNAVQAAIDGVESMTGALKQSMDDVASAFDISIKTAESSRRSTGAFLEWVKNTLDNGKNEVKEAVIPVTEALDIQDEAKEAAASTANEYTDTMAQTIEDNGVENVEQSLTLLSAALTQFIDQWSAGVQEKLTAWLENARNTIKDGLKGIKKTVSNKLAKIGEAIEKMAKQIEQAMNSLIVSASDWGQAFGEAFAAGIESQLSRVQSASRALANAAKSNQNASTVLQRGGQYGNTSNSYDNRINVTVNGSGISDMDTFAAKISQNIAFQQSRRRFATA